MTNLIYLDQPWVTHAGFINDYAPYPVSHSSTIMETRHGTLLTTWFGGSQKRAPDVKIYLARWAEGKWSEPQMIAIGHLPDGSPIQCWNPVLFQPKDGPLLLFYKVGPSPNDWWGMLKTSNDEGQTWSSAAPLPEGILGPVRNKPVQLTDGSLLCPGSTEGHREHPGWRIHFERTADFGQTWKQISVPFDDMTPDAIQPCIMLHGNGNLQAIGRTKASRIYSTESIDQGRNWSKVKLIDLPNPNSGIDAMTLKDGRLALVYNHNPQPGGLTPLNLAISNDGNNWKAAALLEYSSGDYSYPSITQSHDGLIHISYSWNWQKIKHVVINPALLQPKDFVEGQWPK